ncbi:hypothetical protein LZ198_18130 [Myxococcus sp. K15C18031901]|uniref:hypothetical protein n=1 Tax=Myxococcus dinghuensis TaxID=2906761 RepID=UPI0020A770AC|nr:hypothetical protein [Myxococcus dinghuensis]MCP3100792.1 hypothetical protein [Myxococcus dinghuensis]
MRKMSALAISVLTSLSLLACNSTDSVDPIGQHESAATSPSVGARTRYLDKDGGCGDKGTNVCSFGFGTTDPTEILTAVGEDRVELTYLEKPDFLLGRGGLAVKEAIPLDEATTSALGLPEGTMVHPQFAPLTSNSAGLMTVSLSVGTIRVDTPDTDTYDPPMQVRCCGDGQIKFCRSCVGGNSSERPPFRGSACCLNSIHYDPDLLD